MRRAPSSSRARLLSWAGLVVLVFGLGCSKSENRPAERADVPRGMASAPRAEDYSDRNLTNDSLGGDRPSADPDRIGSAAPIPSTIPPPTNRHYLPLYRREVGSAKDAAILDRDGPVGFGAGQGGGVDALEGIPGGIGGRSGATKGQEKAKAPQVWKRDAKRPTFARVYVGDGNSLELVSLQVTVTVEGPRARTLVDHIFHNPHGRQLEGTFEYPLPSGASPSYFAMFLGQTRDTVPPRFARRGDAPPLPADKLAQLPPQQLVLNVGKEDWGAL